MTAPAFTLWALRAEEPRVREAWVSLAQRICGECQATIIKLEPPTMYPTNVFKYDHLCALCGSRRF